MAGTLVTLQIRLCTGSDRTGPRAVSFPEVRIEGTEEGLRLLRRRISWVIRSSQAQADAHAHMAGSDGPEISMVPDNLLLTIGRLPDTLREPQ